MEKERLEGISLLVIGSAVSASMTILQVQAPEFLKGYFIPLELACGLLVLCGIQMLAFHRPPFLTAWSDLGKVRIRSPLYFRTAIVAATVVDTPLVEVADRTFHVKNVPLDGHLYIKCRFEQCTFTYNGGQYRFIECQIVGGYGITSVDTIVSQTLNLVGDLAEKGATVGFRYPLPPREEKQTD